MKKKTKWTLSIIGGLIFLLLIQIYRVDIRKEVWTAPDGGPNVYAALDHNGRVMTFTFLPGNKLIVGMEGFCLQEAEYEGRKGNQFIDVLWKTNIPDRHWAQDFSYVEKGYRPVSLKITPSSNKGMNCAGFIREGKTVYKYAEFSHSMMKLDGKVFVKVMDGSLQNLNISEVLTYLE